MNSIPSENPNFTVLSCPTSLIKRKRAPLDLMTCSPSPNALPTMYFYPLEAPRVRTATASTHSDVSVQTLASVTHSVTVKDSPTHPTHRIEEVCNSFHDCLLRKRLFMQGLVPCIVLVRELGAEYFHGILSRLDSLIKCSDGCHLLKLIIKSPTRIPFEA